MENTIRPIAVGRNNYLFPGSHERAQRASVAYTILAACNSNNINPLTYLAELLQKFPSRTVQEIEDLMPKYWTEPVISD